MTWPTSLQLNAYDPEVGVAASSPFPADADLWATRDRPRAMTFLAQRPPADGTDFRHPDVGWGLIVPVNPDCKGKDAEALVDYADAQDPIVDLWKARGCGPVFRYDHAASDRLILIRRARDGGEVLLKGGPAGIADGALPRYLLIYGDPSEIPWDLQYELQENKNCYVGRLPFRGKDKSRDAANYVRAACGEFKASPADKGAALVWSPVWADEWDFGITRLMRDLIGAPVYQKMTEDSALAPLFLDGLEQTATIDRLFEELAARKPALVVSTSHGQTGPLSDAAALAAALGLPLDQKKTAVKPQDLMQKWNPGGAIWYAHACCSAGSDRNSNFTNLLDRGTTADETVRKVAELGSTVAPLPLQLLKAEHPVRAFIGHVEPTFDFSLHYPARMLPTTDSLQQALSIGLYQEKPEPIGLAMRRWWDRIGECLGTFDSSYLEYNSGKDEEMTPVMVWSRLAARDVKTTVILGDPAVSLPV